MSNDLPYQNLPEMFFDQADRLQNKTALLSKKEGLYTPISWLQFKTQVLKAVRSFQKLGIGSGDCVALLSENRPEWAITDLAVQSFGACLVPVYATSSIKEVGYVVRHSEAKVIVVSTAEQFCKVQSFLIESSSVRHIIVMDGPAASDPRVLNWESFLGSSQVSDSEEKAIRQNVEKIQPDHLATVIYTSGTTGPPKGVMLSHRNFLINCWDAKHAIDLRPDDVSLSFLPLSHVFERTAGYYFPIMVGSTIAYAESMNTVPENLLEVKPTVASSVPRLYEKIHEKIMDKIRNAPPLRKKLANWAIKVGYRTAPYRLVHKSLPALLAIQYKIAKLLIFNKLQKQLGGRMRFFISGGAPLSKQIAEFFYAAGVVILEGYGLTETSPVIAVNRLDRLKFGTVGIPFDHVEVRIADDGEIAARGPSIMKGYYKDDTATNEVIRDGWFYTGDIGQIDSEGFLSITDRKKDLIVTSGGKNIAPQNIENSLTRHPLIQQAVILGDRYNFLTALIVPKFENLAKQLGKDEVSKRALIAVPEAYRLIAEAIREQTLELPNYEKVKTFRMLDEEFSQEKGELTPTLKVKRKIVADRYRQLIEEMCAEVEERKKHDPSLSKEVMGG